SLIVIASFSLSVALAQDAKTLTYTAPVEGEITNAAFSEVWTMETASADRLDVRVERTGGNLIPELVILDSNDQQLTSGYGADQTAANSEIENYTLPGGGTFKVLVQRRDGGTGVSTGTYRLTVTPRATADDNPNNITPIGEITLGTPVTGEITGAHWYQRYTFTANAGDVIRVEARRTSESLFPEVEVLDANGTAVYTAYNDYRTGETATSDNVELPGAGTYTVAVTRVNRFNGDSVGGYELEVTLAAAGEDSPLLAQSAGEIAYDTDLSGSISARWYEDWTLTTQAGDTITITATRKAGNLQPQIFLLGGSGQELSRGYTSGTGDSAGIDRVTLQGAGTYTVRVSRYGDKTGYTTGDYTLRVDLMGSGVDSPALADLSGTLELGTATSEIITGERWRDTWAFTGKQDDRIDIVVRRTEGTLIPRVQLQDSNGQVLTEAWPDQSLDIVRIQGATLPGDGDYRIVVFRDGEQTGQTTGSYEVLVREAE
ncbi:MAG: hypothetical protein JNM70_13060, partial [Anaerolineae bacterium]|nr:hypothetical protein [Anaerolineae bacterium]